MPRRPDETLTHADPYSAERVRQGRIILRKPWMKAVFLIGLVATVLAALFFSR
jgi:hypothetical protein